MAAASAMWALQQESLLGPPGPVRTLAAEALVIAGWVVMWRPIELLVFDPMRPLMECRLLSRVLRTPVTVEFVDQTRDALGRGCDAAVRSLPRSTASNKEGR